MLKSLFTNINSFTETNSLCATVTMLNGSHYHSLLFCRAPVVFFFFIFLSPHWCLRAESWTTSKMSPPSTVFEAAPVIYKQISMPNQDHSLSPRCLVLQNSKPPFSAPTVNFQHYKHSLRALECKLETLGQSISSKEVISFSLSLAGFQSGSPQG